MVTLELVSTLEGHTDRVWSVAWNHNGTLLATCSGDKAVRLWRQEGSRWIQVGQLNDAHQRAVRALAFSPDSKLLASASFDATVAVWELSATTGEYELLANLEGHENEVKSISWSVSGALLATCGRDKSVWVWEVEADNEFSCAAVLQEHTQDVKMVVWHPYDDLLASCSYDDTIKLWSEDGHDWTCSDTLRGHTSTVWAIDFDAAGDRLASVSDDCSLRIWRKYMANNAEGIDTGHAPFKYVCSSVIEGHHTRTIYSVSWSRNNIIATGAGDDSIRLFTATGASDSFTQHLAVEGAHTSDINCVCWNPADPTLLASASDDRTVKLWRLRS